MLRRAKNVLAVLTFAALAGCQNYNFNPVGHCIIQPGATTFTLNGFTSADVLFVVDDSGSMAAKQKSLADNFQNFIDALNSINTDRVSKSLEPVDFHIAITTSSIYEDNSVPNLSSPKTTATCGSDLTCYIGAPDNPNSPTKYTCNAQGDTCGDLDKYFRGGSGCPSSSTPYPDGSFVGALGNPKVLHFDKALYKDANGQPNPTAIAALVTQFKQNVAVGDCGSGQEQHLEAAYQALDKAVRTKTQTESGWPHEAAKMILVFVGDEDDCSSPADSTNSVVSGAMAPTKDGCTADAAKPIDQQKLFNVNTRYVDYFSSLTFQTGDKKVRPLGAAFIVSTSDAACGQTSLGAGCSAGICKFNGASCTCPYSGSLCNSWSCDGWAPGNRLLSVASGLKDHGADVVVGSVCDSNFGTILANIANLLRPPNTLSLKTTPADSQVTLLRITDPSGKQRKVCKGPAPVGDTSGTYDWWFATADTNTVPVPSVPSKLVYINHATGNCELNAGETYSAEYLGMVPEGGCTADTDCSTALGGSPGQWHCTGSSGTRGTCLCNGAP